MERLLHYCNRLETRRETANMISDETAYRRYLDGEPKAADLLVEKYGDALTLYINGYLKDIHEAEDLMIEAFSRIFAKERPITGTGSFKAYLYKTARNLAFRYKKKHRLGFVHFDELDFEPRSDMLLYVIVSTTGAGVGWIF